MRGRDEVAADSELLLFCAYSARARELRRGGMLHEAASAGELAAGYFRRAGAIPWSDVAPFARLMELADCVAVYAADDAAPEQAATAIVDRLVLGGAVTDVALLPEGHPVRLSAPALDRARTAMDSGDWAAAVHALGDLGRRSPATPWLVFAKAMVAYGQRDGAALGRALDRLPAGFPLGRAAARLKRLAAASTGGRLSADTHLVERAGVADTLAAKLVRAVEEFDLERIAGLLPPLAQALYPAEPSTALYPLLSLVAVQVAREGLDFEPLIRVIVRLLPRAEAEVIGPRIAMLQMSHQHHPQFLACADAADYLSVIARDFPEPKLRGLARACVLEQLARSARKAGVEPAWLHPDNVAAAQALCGDRDVPPDDILAELMRASLRANPDNRDGHRFVLTELRRSGAGRKKSKAITRALEDMAAAFPDSPEPWLELSDLHQLNRAHRKAAAALERALERAPHDDRIHHRRAIGYLVASDRNRERRNYALSRKDLLTAEAFAPARLRPLVAVKQLALSLTSSDRPPEEVLARAVRPEVTTVARVRSLMLLVKDLSARSGSATAAMLRAQIAGLSGEVATLSPDDRLVLVAAVEPEAECLFADRHVVTACPELWPSLLNGLEGGPLLRMSETLLAAGEPQPVHVALERHSRRRWRRAPDPAVRLYLAAAHYIHDERSGRDPGSRPFQKLLQRARNEDLPRLRAAARRLAEFTPGRLADALRGFDFTLLDMPAELLPLPPMLIPPAVFFDDDDPDARFPVCPRCGQRHGPDDAPDDADDAQEQDDALAAMEELIADAGLAGAPGALLRELGGDLRSDSTRRRGLDELARDVEPRRDELSRELDMILYPRRKGAKKRKKRR